jgi:hypothetical protein
MLAMILIAFPYAHDHHTVKPMTPGDLVDIDDGVFEGLKAEGYIREATDDEIAAAQEGEVVVVEAAPVEIPADWATLDWFPLRKLAIALGAPANVKKAAAIALVEATLAQREA